MNWLKANPLTRTDWLMIIVAMVLSFMAGAAILVIPSSYAAIIVLVATAAVMAAFSFIRRPAWALYFTIILVLLPADLLPAEINSLLNRGATVMTFAVWFLDVIGHRRSVRITPSAVLMLLFVAWSAVTWLWAAHSADGLETLQVYILRLLLFLLVAVNVIKTRADLDGLMSTLAFSGGLLVVASVWSILVQGYVPGTRLQVLDVNENALGVALLATFPGVFWWAMRTSDRLSPLKYLLAFAFLLSSIVLTGLSGSRGSAISLGITLVMFLFWKSTRPWGVAAIIIVGLAVVAAPYVFSTTIERFLGAPGETILGGRENIWPAAWHMIQDYMILGVGIGNSSYEVIPYLVNQGGFWTYQEQEFLHNPVLVIWSETGLIGLVFYLGVLIATCISAARDYIQRIRNKARGLLPYYAVVLSTFVGFLASWIKGGGMETDFDYFLLLTLLLIPSFLKHKTISEQWNNE